LAAEISLLVQVCVQLSLSPYSCQQLNSSLYSEGYWPWGIQEQLLFNSKLLNCL